MGKPFVLSLTLCFLLLSGCMAFRQQPEQNACQFHRLNALKPDNQIKTEAGEIETWNLNDQSFQCTGVALSTCIMEPNALRLPSYVNTPQLLYVREGEGRLGMVIPGCAETFEDPLRQGQRQGRRKGWSSQHDRHQKVRRIREGDIIAVLAGMVHWIYNSGQTQLVIVALFDTNSHQNQLGQIPQRFYLGGNQEQEFQRYQQKGRGQQQQHEQQQSREQKQSHERGEKEQPQNKGSNILSGFFTEWLANTFNIDMELAEKLKGKNDTRKGGLVKVKGQLRIIGSSPSEMTGRSQSEKEGEDEEKQQQQENGSGDRRGSSRGSSGSQSNALEETLCTMRLKENIGKSTTPDIYNPRAGSVRTVNNLNLPVLQWLKLSAERGSLHKGCMFVPHYNINAHGIVYALRGKAHIQVVDCSGNTVFDGVLEQGEALPIPQNFAVAVLALTEKFEYVTFKTSERAMIATLAGRSSVIRGLPEDVIAVSFNLRKEEARDVKNKNDNIYLIEADSSGISRAVA